MQIAGNLRALRLYLCWSSNLDGYPETFIVRVTDGHANVYSPSAELQHIVRPRIGRKPVVPLDVFAKRFKTRKHVFLPVLLNVRNRFPISLYNLKVRIIHPDAPLKVPLVLLQFLGTDIENISIELIDGLAPNILDIVFGQFVAVQHEGLHVLQVIQILLGHLNSLQRRSGRIRYFLVAFPVRGKKNVAPHLVFAGGHSVAVNRLYYKRLSISVVIPFLLELRLARRKTLNDLVHGRGGWLMENSRGRALGRGRRCGSRSRRIRLALRRAGTRRSRQRALLLRSKRRNTHR